MQSPKKASALEGLLAAGGLFALIGAQIVLTRSSYLLHKNFWIDEFCTYVFATDASLSHAIRALQGGVDTNPPALHLLLFAGTTLTGMTSETGYRSLALLSMVLALTGIYVGLRQSFGVLAALAATLAIWCHPLIMHHAFEVRFYALWLAATVWLCHFLGRARVEKAPGRLTRVGLAVCSLALCTVHYFGILTLFLVVGTDWWWNRNRERLSRDTLAAVALGPVALAWCVILFLPSQRAAMTGPTWIENPSMARIAQLGLTLFLPIHLGAVIMAGWGSRLWSGDTASEETARPLATGAPVLIGLTSLVLMFPVLIAFSYLVQPALISRYAIAAIAGLAPAIAYSVSRMTRPWIVLLIGFFVATSAYELRNRAVLAADEDRRTQDLIDQIRTDTGGNPVFFEAPHQLLVTWHYAPDLRGRIFLIDFEHDQLGENVSPFRIVGRDVGRTFAEFYGWPALEPWGTLRDLNALYLIPHGESYIRPPSPEQRYDDFVMVPIKGELTRLVRKEASSVRVQ